MTGPAKEGSPQRIGLVAPVLPFLALLRLTVRRPALPDGAPLDREIYHFERHGQALASPSIYDAILFGERMIKAMERLILDPDEPRHQGKNRAVTLHHRKFTMKDVESFLPPDEEAGLEASQAAQLSRGAAQVTLSAAAEAQLRRLAPRLRVYRRNRPVPSPP